MGSRQCSVQQGGKGALGLTWGWPGACVCHVARRLDAAPTPSAPLHRGDAYKEDGHHIDPENRHFWPHDAARARHVGEHVRNRNSNGKRHKEEVGVHERAHTWQQGGAATRRHGCRAPIQIDRRVEGTALGSVEGFLCDCSSLGLS